VQLIETGVDMTKYLRILVERGFISTASYLRGFLLEKLGAVAGFQIDGETFNSDVLFQLNYLGKACSELTILYVNLTEKFRKKYQFWLIKPQENIAKINIIKVILVFSQNLLLVDLL